MYQYLSINKDFIHQPLIYSLTIIDSDWFVSLMDNQCALFIHLHPLRGAAIIGSLTNRAGVDHREPARDHMLIFLFGISSRTYSNHHARRQIHHSDEYAPSARERLLRFSYTPSSVKKHRQQAVRSFRSFLAIGDRILLVCWFFLFNIQCWVFVSPSHRLQQGSGLLLNSYRPLMATPFCLSDIVFVVLGYLNGWKALITSSLPSSSLQCLSSYHSHRYCLKAKIWNYWLPLCVKNT